MLFRLFRLPPMVYLVLAPLCLAAGVAMLIYENGRDAERTAALSHDAPALIELAAITSDDSGSDFNEVTVRAQVDPMNMIEMVKTKRGSERGRTLYAPLYPADAADFSGEALAVMEISGSVSDDQLAQFYVSDGAAGPVLVLNGLLEGAGNNKAFDALGQSVKLTNGFRTIKPFVNGRQVDLKPTGMGNVLLMLSLVLAAIFGGYGYFRKRSVDKARAEEEAHFAEQAPG